MSIDGSDDFADRFLHTIQRAKLSSSQDPSKGISDPPNADTKKDLLWGVLFNRTILLHAHRVGHAWKIDCQWFDEALTTNVTLDQACDVSQAEITWQRFLSEWKPPTHLRSSNDIVMSIYKFFSAPLATERQVSARKVVGITSVLLGTVSIGVGCLLVTYHAGCIIGGALGCLCFYSDP
jgi:hypothetical protein